MCILFQGSLSFALVEAIQLILGHGRLKKVNSCLIKSEIIANRFTYIYCGVIERIAGT